ncbi:MAG: hypothetical protein OXC81_06735, partial [Betaproteobacteria bacterium]|nr:hypothetical protein [Betaproteobacteria bacterium]
MESKLTTTLQKYVQRAHAIALERDHPTLEPLHVLAAMAEDSSGVLASVAKFAGVELAVLRSRIDSALAAMPALGKPKGMARRGGDRRA